MAIVGAPWAMPGSPLASQLLDTPAVAFLCVTFVAATVLAGLTVLNVGTGTALDKQFEAVAAWAGTTRAATAPQTHGDLSSEEVSLL